MTAFFPARRPLPFRLAMLNDLVSSLILALVLQELDLVNLVHWTSRNAKMEAKEVSDKHGEMIRSFERTLSSLINANAQGTQVPKGISLPF